MKETILQIYKEVFDEDGNVKLCGRYRCMGLIKACQEISPGIDYGNLTTGFMNVANIKSLLGTLYLNGEIK